MKKGSILGVDLNEKSCQISYYDENKEEPETMEAAVDNYQIPLILGYYKDRWGYGQEAKSLKRLIILHFLFHIRMWICQRC